MKDVLLSLLHVAVLVATLCRPGGVGAVMSENLLLGVTRRWRVVRR